MNRRHFLASLPLLAQSRATAAAPPPNIVYMYADDLGYGDVSCYGAKRVQTPNLDRAADDRPESASLAAYPLVVAPAGSGHRRGWRSPAWRARGRLPGICLAHSKTRFCLIQ
jgi:Sulfatase